MGKRHLVVQGECLASIAKQYGVVDYHQIYDHSQNAALKRQRPNPNLLFPGDIVFVPEKQERQQAAATTRRHEFQLSQSPARLRLVLRDDQDQPLKNTPCLLRIGEQVFQKPTDDSGLLEVDAPVPTPPAELTLETPHWSASLLIGSLDPIDTISGVQARLLNLGYRPGPVDGVTGPRTTRAIRTFQQDHAPLTVDGLCGPRTRAQLQSVYGC